MIRSILWLAFFGAFYFWLVSSGRDEAFFQKGKELYQSVITWFDETEIEFHFKKEKGKKKRRWD